MAEELGGMNQMNVYKLDEKWVKIRYVKNSKPCFIF